MDSDTTECLTAADGWCRQHHPETVEAKDDAATERWNDRRAGRRLRKHSPELYAALISEGDTANDALFEALLLGQKIDLGDIDFR